MNGNSLRREKVLPVATDLITQFNPAVPDHDAAIRALELIAREVAPALGWKPSAGPAAARDGEPAQAAPVSRPSQTTIQRGRSGRGDGAVHKGHD